MGRFLDDPRPGKTDHTIWLGHNNISEGRKARCDTARRGMGQDRDVGKPGGVVAGEGTTNGARLWRVYVMGDTQAVAAQGGNVVFGFHEG